MLLAGITYALIQSLVVMGVIINDNEKRMTGDQKNQIAVEIQQNENKLSRNERER